jgi:hypothetical protein
MLNNLFRNNEDLTEPNGPVRIQDKSIQHGRVRRIMFYWYSQNRGFYGPNGFTADWRLGRSRWLVRAVSGLAAAELMPGAAVDEFELARAAKVIFEAVLKDQQDAATAQERAESFWQTC